ncbi:hypothetical protein LDENG_00048600 [Lucifuga dentata]|nr:hypothetical protein LDENG_00048600 [Lucifuga dentata]
MRTVITAVILKLCFCLTGAVSPNAPSETTVTAAPGDILILPCYTLGNVTPSVTTWIKNGLEIISGGQATAASPDSNPTPGQQRLAVLHDGSLNVQGVIPGDEGEYLCKTTLPNNGSFQATVQLQVASGPENVSTTISPSIPLPNGTVLVYQGSTVYFVCSSSSYPSQQLTWAFSGVSSRNDSLVSTAGPLLEFIIENIQPSAQGVYSCKAQNTVSNQITSRSTEMIVYYTPDRHPECQWGPGEDASHFQFSCTWFGWYTTPMLRWVGNGDDPRTGLKETTFASEETDSLSVTLNRSLLFDGQTLTCTAQHPALHPGKERTCSFTLKPPYPDGEPLVTALEATSVTLTCTEASSIPPANTIWKKSLQQDDIVPGTKYVLSQQGPVFSLTIVNITKDDEGIYFCRSENPLAIRELEVYLTVRTSSANTGAIIGIFLAVLIVGSAIIIAKTVYSSRHRICLGSGFGQMEDGGDVLRLVESDDEQLFQDAVPHLPPLANGHHTTLVQIHRIPSSDHEDTEVADTSPQQQEDTAQTEEPVDLVTF